MALPPASVRPALSEAEGPALSEAEGKSATANEFKVSSFGFKVLFM